MSRENYNQNPPYEVTRIVVSVQEVIKLTGAEVPAGNTGLLNEIEEIRSEVKQNEKVGLRAQEDICRILDEALECLDKRGRRSLNKATFKIRMARQRLTQAEGQKRRLVLAIGVWTAVILGVGAWAIYQGGFWPKGAETAAREILFGAVLWGLVGAALDGFRELHTRVARQELDPNRLTWYLVHPLLGGGLGGILFLLVSAGLLATGQDVVDFNPSLPLILAALAGFEQQNVIRYFRDTIRQVLRIEEKGADEGG